jgi:hypothetical protein
MTMTIAERGVHDSRRPAIEGQLFPLVKVMEYLGAQLRQAFRPSFGFLFVEPF